MTPRRGLLVPTLLTGALLALVLAAAWLAVARRPELGRVALAFRAPALHGAPSPQPLPSPLPKPTG